MTRVRFGVLASHEGTTLQAILDACAAGAIDATIAVVVSNNSGARALTRAQQAGIPTLHLSGKTHPSPAALDEAMLEALESRGVDVVVLAGYMKKLGPRTLTRFRGRIVNTHPALLPRHGGPGMFGMHVHRAVLASGDEVTGASIHLVTEEYDAGPVLRQVRVPVVLTETAEELAARVQKSEQQLLVTTLAEIAQGRILPVTQVRPEDAAGGEADTSRHGDDRAE